MATLIATLLDTAPHDISWSQCRAIPATKALVQPPFAQVDGGGCPSQPDWSQGARDAPDIFHDLRIQWMRQIVVNRLDKKLIAHLALESKDPPFSEADLQPFKTILEAFLASHHLPINWQIREHQPMALHVLHTLQSLMRDRDTSLFPSLLEGVRTGFDTPIPRSRVFPLANPSDTEPDPQSVHLTNWKSAEDDPQLTSDLVQEEVERGFVFEFNGTLEEAQRAYPIGISVGKLGIAYAEGRPPRLVVDSSVCGLNGRCTIPERSTLPSAKEVLRAFPLRDSTSELEGFSIDIKSAHKRIVLHPDEQGLVGFSLNQRLFFYRVTPFGATFSASWWSRLGGWILRFWHLLIWWPHVGLLYVDDFLFFMKKSGMPLTAALLRMSCQLFGIPVSWKKTVIGPAITWIGWTFHFRAGTVTIPADKLDKMIKYIDLLIRSPRTTRKSLEKTIGLAMWITQLFPLMRVW